MPIEMQCAYAQTHSPHTFLQKKPCSARPFAAAAHICSRPFSMSTPSLQRLSTWGPAASYPAVRPAPFPCPAPFCGYASTRKSTPGVKTSIMAPTAHPITHFTPTPATTDYPHPISSPPTGPLHYDAIIYMGTILQMLRGHHTQKKSTLVASACVRATGPHFCMRCDLEGGA